MHAMDGWVWSFSQCWRVSGVTPSRPPASPLLILSMSRRFLMCSPRVRGSKSVSFGLGAFSRSGTSCKRATRPCAGGFRAMRTCDCRCNYSTVMRSSSTFLSCCSIKSTCMARSVASRSTK